MYPPMGDILTFGWDSAHALIFPCESFAQAAIDGFMAQRKASDYYCDIQDLDDPERGALEPIWTGPTDVNKWWLAEHPAYTCGCGIYVHPSRRNALAIHIMDCPFTDNRHPT